MTNPHRSGEENSNNYREATKSEDTNRIRLVPCGKKGQTVARAATKQRVPQNDGNLLIG
jgi:hypothetical protein